MFGFASDECALLCTDRVDAKALDLFVAMLDDECDFGAPSSRELRQTEDAWFLVAQALLRELREGLTRLSRRRCALSLTCSGAE